MSETTNIPPPNNDLQVIALNVSYSLLYESEPRSGNLKVIINGVPADLLKKTELTRKHRFTNPGEKIPLSDEERLVKKAVDMATLNTVTNLQRRFSELLDDMRSVSKETFEELEILSYEEFAENLEDSLENDGVKEYNIDEEVKKQECGICLESYTLSKKLDLSGSRKRTLEDKEDISTKKKQKTNDYETTDNLSSSSEEGSVLYTHEPVILENCPHIFGRSCLYSWGNKNNSCPLCRTKISNKNSEYTMDELNDVLQQDERLTSMNFTELLEQANTPPSPLPTNNRIRTPLTGLNGNDADALSQIRGSIQGLFPDFANRFSQVLERSISESIAEGGSNTSNANPEQDRGTVYIVSGNNPANRQPVNNDSTVSAANNYNLGRIIEIIRGNVRNQASPAMAILDMLATLFNAASPEGSTNTTTSETSNDTNDTNNDNPSTDPRSRHSQSDIDASNAIAEAVRMAVQYRHRRNTEERNNSEEQNNSTNDSSENNESNE